MSNIVAGVGRGQLEVLDERVAQRRAVFNRYYEAFANVPGIVFQPELENTMSNRWLTALTIDPEEAGVSRHEIIERLAEDNIEASPVWKPMHMQSLFDGVTYYQQEEGNSESDYLFEYGIFFSSCTNMTVDKKELAIAGYN